MALFLRLLYIEVFHFDLEGAFYCLNLGLNSTLCTISISAGKAVVKLR